MMYILEREDVLIWRALTDSIDVMVSKENRRKIRHVLRSNGWEPSVIIKDVQKLIDESTVLTSSSTDTFLRTEGHRMDFKNYPSIEVIEEFFAYLQINFGSLVYVSTIGLSVEKQPIKMITISNDKPGNSRILLTAGHHAREWISITTALYIINNLATKEQVSYVRNIDWYIIPLVNPDGYNHSITTDRLWRKNRRPMDKCTGVDLNRNYPFFFELEGITVKDPCSIIYSGPSYLSEPETQAIHEALKSMGRHLPMAYVDIHSYGQKIVFPWAGSNTSSPHLEYLKRNAQQMKRAILNQSGKNYTVGLPSSMLYQASGTSQDYFHSMGVPLCFTIEARDKGTHGFLLPASEILPTGEEILDAIKTLGLFSLFVGM